MLRRESWHITAYLLAALLFAVACNDDKPKESEFGYSTFEDAPPKKEFLSEEMTKIEAVAEQTASMASQLGEDVKAKAEKGTEEIKSEIASATNEAEETVQEIVRDTKQAAKDLIP
ncbi:MAG: hypothetical protein IT291_09820 [Deltaproteobacteria bacterium]|nr:hypothetical protein [Deltaproteobacteria bacterium]